MPLFVPTEEIPSTRFLEQTYLDMTQKYTNFSMKSVSLDSSKQYPSKTIYHNIMSDIILRAVTTILRTTKHCGWITVLHFKHNMFYGHKQNSMNLVPLIRRILQIRAHLIYIKGLVEIPL